MAEARLHPETRIGAVHLTVSDLARSLRFYVDQLGFRERERAIDRASLGVDGPDLLVLVGDPSAQRPAGTTGLYHFAILLPSRGDLAEALRRLRASGTRIDGAADHGVSEAIYLRDPDGNGIEIYSDRPRGLWKSVGDRVDMPTAPLDVEALLALPRERGTVEWMPPETRMGHVHLHVSHLPKAEAFYVGVLGFDVRARYGSSALFVAAGGYHHHVGLNTWKGVGAPPPPPGAIGLRHFTLTVPSEAERDRVASRLRAASVPMEALGADFLVRDPSSNAILLSASR